MYGETWCYIPGERTDVAMVVIPKPSRSIRICVDLKPLNKSVMREIHSLPKVDITLAQLRQVPKFS